MSIVLKRRAEMRNRAKSVRVIPLNQTQMNHPMFSVTCSLNVILTNGVSAINIATLPIDPF